MSAWGYGPFDNAAASDFMSTISAALSVLQDVRCSDSRAEQEEGRAALATAVALGEAGYSVSLNHLYDGIVLLERLLADGDEYIENYDFPARMRAQLQKELKAAKRLRTRLREKSGRRRGPVRKSRARR